MKMALKFAVNNLCRSIQLCVLKTYPVSHQRPSCSLYNAFSCSFPVRCLSADSSSPKTGKRPVGPYMMFASEKFAGMQKANPGVKVTDLASMIGQMWRVLPENEKEPYRARYAAEKANSDVWKASLSEEDKKKLLEQVREKKRQRINRRQKKLKKEFNRPVPSDVNPFFLFVKATTIERGDAPLAQYIKGLSEQWKIMPEEDKEEYVKTARANSVLHRQRVAEWKKRMILEGHAEVLKLKPTKKAASRKRAAPKKKKAARANSKSSASKDSSSGTKAANAPSSQEKTVAKKGAAKSKSDSSA